MREGLGMASIEVSGGRDLTDSMRWRDQPSQGGFRKTIKDM
jgi:hypothetical protein